MTHISKLAILALASAMTLAACSKGSQSSTTSTTTTTQSAASAAPSSDTMANAAASPAANGVAASHGAKIFQTNCSSCHQANGKGVPGTFPPLAGNATVNGPATKVIHIVKYGLTGKVAVKGTTYNGMMPAWGTQLSNADIADVVTYVRSAWGNHASAVSVTQVAAVKK